MKKSSLRLRLLKLIALPLLAGLAGMASLAYFSAKKEAEEIYDAQLAHFARVMGTLAQHEVQEGDTETKTIRMDPEKFVTPYEKDVAYRVWLDGDILLQSENANRFGPPTQTSGFTDRKINHDLWRLFVLHEGNVTVEVAEDYHARRDLVEHVAASIILPFLFVLPLIFCAIGIGMRLGFAPLDNLSKHIRSQRPDALQPIHLPNVPQEIRPIIESLNQLMAQVERALEREKRFTGYAAHELRTPIAALKTQVQVALRSRNREEQEELFVEVEKGIDRMGRLVEQLLALVRAQKMEQSMQPVSIPPLLSQMVNDFAAMAQARQLHFDVHVTEHAVVFGNPEMLTILLRNVLDNAIRYSPAGGSIVINQILEDKTVYIAISNHTVREIPPSELQHIFEPFYRIKEVNVEGTGLGLSIAQWIAKQHHAQINCEAVRDVFTIHIRIPTLLE